nr:MAG TPA: hypothetical protein [Caudoviricetes sp.]
MFSFCDMVVKFFYLSYPILLFKIMLIIIQSNLN